ncbi:hypothetical protein SAMN05660206_10442 [Sphingobacterium wenxiniae]|uniref:Fibronectin type-III domain-containing protein n=2 Tax=Sphingobacterium wenxiniae TaxID=683125 RepID=A0A1I6S011_9SPHI|nr:hypothetical protein SAMN05660206_10442 [Sphingobacterium wenxiniae]
MLKPTIRSHNISDVELLDYCYIISAEMEKNQGLFPNPVPSLADFKKEIRAFSDACSDAAYRDKRMLVIRDSKRKDLLNLLRILSSYVHFVAKGDKGIILAAGFVPSKKRSSANRNPDTPEDFRAEGEIGTGKMKLRVKASPKVYVYRFEYRKKIEGEPWQVVLSSRSRCVIENLAIREEYEFRVCFVGRNSQSPYSFVVSSYVY